MKQKLLPKDNGAGGISWVGEGKKTVDVAEMERRCTSLGITVNWKRLRKIVDHRNDVEHLFPTVSQEALRTFMADVFVVIRDFLRTELGKDPLVELGEPTWTTLTKVAEVYAKEKAECSAKITQLGGMHYLVVSALREWQCPGCGSGLIDVLDADAQKQSLEFNCRVCGKVYDFETAAGDAIKDYFWADNHLSVQDGGDLVTVRCPYCSADSYHLSEDCCLLCEESIKRDCELCGIRIPSSELDGSGVCSYCAHKMSRDD